MAGLKFTFTGDNQDVLKKINQIQIELKKVYNKKNTKIDLSAGVDFSLLGENFKRLDQQSREAFDNMSKDAQKYVKEIQQNILSLQQVEKMQAGLNSLYEDGDIDLNAYIQSQARLTVLHEELSKGINESRVALEAETNTNKIATDSIAGLHAKVLMLTTDYMNLSKAQREGTEGMTLLKNLQETQIQLDNASLSMNKYASGAKTKFDSLGMSITQIARELPSLAMGPQMFFLAISNNLGPFQDALAAARKEYQDMVTAGQKGIPVWKQLLSSLMGAGPVLAVVTTLFVTFGDDIIKWVGKLFRSSNAVDDMVIRMKNLSKVMKDGAEQSAAERVELDMLYKVTQDHTRSLKERNDATDELQRKYPRYFGDLTNEAILAGNAATVYQSLTDNILKAAQARAAMKIIEDNYNKIYQLQKAINADTNWTNRNKEKTKEGKASAKTVVGSSITGYTQTGEILTKEAEEYNRRKKALEENTEAVNALKAANDALIKSIDVSAFVTNNSSSDTKPINAYSDQLHRIAELRSKSSRERIRLEVELANQEEQARIDAMQDGFEKEERQRKLNNKMELESIERQKQDYINKVVDTQRQIFEAEENAKSSKDKNYKKKTFDPSSVSVDTSVFDTIKGETLKKQTNETTEYYNDILAKYQSFTEQRISIEKKYRKDEEILQKKAYQSQNEAERLQYKNALKELIKQREKDLEEISKSEIENTGIWRQLMGDLESLPTDALEKLLHDAEKLVKVSNLSATDMKSMMDTINDARQNLVARNPFKTLKEEYEKYQKAIKKGDKQGAASYWTNIEKATDSIKSNISILGSSLAELGGVFSNKLSDGIQSAVSAINSGITAFEVFGKQGEKSSGDIISGISGVVGIVSTLVGGIVSLFDNSKKDQERNLEYQRRQEGYWEAINYQTERYLKLLEQAAGNDYFSTSSTALKNLEDARNKAQKDIVASVPAGDLNMIEAALKHWFETGEKLPAFDSVNKATSKEIIDFINSNGGYDLENKLISEDAIISMKNNADIWSKLPSWMQDAINKFVELNDQADELKSTLNENLFQTTSKSIEEAILNGLKEGKRGLSDFGEDFENIMRDALLQSFVVDQLRGKAQEFYKKYTLLADSDEDGKLDLTADEITTLRKDWNDLIKAATEEAGNIDSIVGSSSSTSQSSTSRGFGSEMTHEDAGELSGRFTALQIAGEETKNQLVLLNQMANALLDMNEIGNATLNDMLYQQLQTNSYLEDIVKYTKPILKFGNKFDKMIETLDRRL